MSNSATRKTLKERIPEVEEVVEVTPEQEPLTSAGVEEASRSQNEKMKCDELQRRHLRLSYLQ